MIHHAHSECAFSIARAGEKGKGNEAMFDLKSARHWAEELQREAIGPGMTVIDATTGTGNESVSAAAGSGCTYLDKTAQPGVRYIYTVRGIDESGKYVTSFNATGVSATAE